MWKQMRCSEFHMIIGKWVADWLTELAHLLTNYALNRSTKRMFYCYFCYALVRLQSRFSLLLFFLSSCVWWLVLVIMWMLWAFKWNCTDREWGSENLFMDQIWSVDRWLYIINKIYEILVVNLFFFMRIEDQMAGRKKWVHKIWVSSSKLHIVCMNFISLWGHLVVFRIIKYYHASFVFFFSLFWSRLWVALFYIVVYRVV